MQLSGLEMSPNSAHSIPPAISTPPDFIFPSVGISHGPAMTSTVSLSSVASSHGSLSTMDLASSMYSHEIGTATPRGAARSPTTNPSGLSILLSGQRAKPDGTTASSFTSGSKTPVPRQNVLSSQDNPEHLIVDLTPPRPKPTPVTRYPSERISGTTETSALLDDVETPGQFYTGNVNPQTPPSKAKFSTKKVLSYVTFDVKDVVATSIRSLPAVVLGVLLNILDGVSCTCSNELRSHET